MFSALHILISICHEHPLLNLILKSSNFDESFSLFDQILRTMFCPKLLLCGVLDDTVGE